MENNGTVKYYHGIRTDATVLVMEHFVGDMISLKILRCGEEQTIAFPLKPLKELMPLFKFDVHPRYFIYCGLVFQPVSLDLLHALYSSVRFFFLTFIVGRLTNYTHRIGTLGHRQNWLIYLMRVENAGWNLSTK